MKKLILSLFFLIPVFLFAQNTWEKKTSFTGSKRARSVSFSIANRGYIVGGEDTLDVEQNDCWEYDPGTDSWTQKATLPASGRRDAIGFTIGLKGYCGTGIDQPDAFNGTILNDFWEYSPATNTWTPKTPFPGNFGGGIYFAAGFAVSGKGYVTCGKAGPSYYSQETWQYNPSNDTWTQKAYFPPGVRYGQASFVLNGKAYVGCGTDENWFTHDFWEYNPATDFWVQKADFPGSSRSFLTAFALGQKGYMGMGTDGGYRDDWFEYDATCDCWNVKAVFPGGGRRSSPSFVISGAGYVMMGKGVTGKHRDLWEYRPYITGVEEISAVNVNVYPNPASEIIHFDVNEDFVSAHNDLSLQLMSVDGKLISEKALNGKSSVSMTNDGWAPGVYIYSLTNGTKNFGGGRVVIR